MGEEGEWIFLFSFILPDFRIENTNVRKERVMKKIAIPTRENAVDNHFGHCAGYTILTISSDNKVMGEEKLPSPQGCGCKSNIASTLEELGVNVMLAGSIGQGALNVLKAHNIEVIRGCSGNVMEVAQSYLKGTLKDSGLSCDHHECGEHVYVYDMRK